MTACATGPADGGAFEKRREPALFAPLEYLDKEAAALHVSGTWEVLPYGELALQVTSVDELMNGEAAPPVTASEIYYACGKALGRPIKAGVDKEKPQLGVRLNEYLEHIVALEDPQWPIDDEERVGCAVPERGPKSVVEVVDLRRRPPGSGAQ